MKRIISAVLLLAFTITLAGCGGDRETIEIHKDEITTTTETTIVVE